jgi:hypothetical protein
MEDDDNWLHGERIECPNCHRALYRVDHSPFYDDDFLYCGRCPIHVEVSFYDPRYGEMARRPGPKPDPVQFMRAIEAELKPCACGGNFRYEAPRRCLYCHAPVITDDPHGVDLLFWSDLHLPGAPDPSDAEAEEEQRQFAPFIRTEDLWKES